MHEDFNERFSQPASSAPQWSPTNPAAQYNLGAPHHANRRRNPFTFLLAFSSVMALFSLTGFALFLYLAFESTESMGYLNMLVLGMTTLIMLTNLAVVGVVKIGDRLHQRNII